ncbi:MAG TPA: NtaA/DmoA family FMN-dependent monooxygenase [Ilumatobacteraceae bacterium]
MTVSADKMRLAWFTIMSPRTWNDPDQGLGYDWSSTELYLESARTLERGLFDMLIVADGYGIVDFYQDSIDEYVRHGLEGAGLMQPLPYLAAIATVTRHLGLVSTMSTHVYPPYLLAREMATLDHVSKGRAGWNIVTSALDIDAQNFGADKLPPPNERYDRADEFVDVCERLWASWDPDAVVMNRKTGEFADPSKVRQINFDGKWFKVRGPLNTVPGPQGRPLYVQAGGSPRGMDFAAQHADVVISHKNSREGMLEYCTEVKERAKKFGRDPKSVKVFFTFKPVIADTQEEAEAARARMHRAPAASTAIGLANLSARIGMDVSVYPLDEPLTLEMIPSDSQGMRGVFYQYYSEGGTPPTLREIAAWEATKESLPIVGTPESVADEIEELREYAGFDGLAIRSALMPATVTQIVDRLIPVLQDRGLVRREFRRSTLRGNLFDEEA